MHTRKQMKSDAKRVLKQHYFLFLLLCMVASMIGGELVMSGTTRESMVEEMTPQMRVTFTDSIVTSFADVVTDVATGKGEDRQRQIRETQAQYAERPGQNGQEIFGRSRGVFAAVVNKLTSGAYLMMLLVGIKSLVGTDCSVLMSTVICPRYSRSMRSKKGTRMPARPMSTLLSFFRPEMM